MDWNTVADNWSAHANRLRQRWPDLPEDDLLAAYGNRTALAVLIAQYSGQTVDEADRDISDWLAGAEPADAVMHPSRDNDRALQARHDIPAGEEASDDDLAFGDDAQPDTPMGRRSG